MIEPPRFSPGDVLIFQVDSGYSLLRLLATDEVDGDTVWHVAAYRDMYLDVEMADEAASDPSKLTVELPHVALTTRAFESTQVSKLRNVLLNENELASYSNWKVRHGELSDRSIRLILGLR